MPKQTPKVDLNPLDKVVEVPARIVESLLITISNHNRAGTIAVSQEIRELAQKQVPEVFPG